MRPAALVVSLLPWVPAVALADEAVVHRGAVVVGLERTIGFALDSRREERTQFGRTFAATSTTTHVGPLWGGGTSPFTAPRLAFDVAVFRYVTFGFSGGAYHGATRSRIDIAGAAAIESDAPDVTTFVVTPRAGLVLPFGDRFALWLRAGLSLHHSTTRNAQRGLSGSSSVGLITSESTLTRSGSAFTVEPSLLFEVIPRVALSLGAHGDFALAGRRTDEGTTDRGTSFESSPSLHHAFGFSLGLSLVL